MKYSVKIAPEKRKNKEGIIKTVNVPVFVDIRFTGTRFFYFTGYRINVDWYKKEKSTWDFNKQEVRKNGFGLEGNNVIQYNIINNRLRSIKAQLEIFFQNKTTATKLEIISLLDESCKKAVKAVRHEDKSEFFATFTKYLADSTFSKDRKIQVNGTMEQWKRYESKRNIVLAFDTFTIDILRDFEKYLKSESTKPKSRKKPTEQIPSPKGQNTIHKIIGITRAFWNYAIKEFSQVGKTIHYPFGSAGYTVPGDSYGSPIYITKEERNILSDAVLETERLQRVRDIFVFQCLIGARVGDLCKLTKDNLQNGVITYIARKTKDKKPVAVTVPLSKKALEILSHYDLPDGRLLPFITDQRYNKYLKELFKKLEINRVVTRLNPNTGEPEQVKLSEIVSSHMARRAFIGNLYGKVDSGIISSMSGHIQGSKAFTRYYDVSKELQQKAIDLID